MKRCYAVNSGVIRNTHLFYTQTGLFFIYKNFNLIKKKKIWFDCKQGEYYIAHARLVLE